MAVHLELRGRLLVAGEATLPVPAEFIYDPEDPMVIEAIFHATDDTVEWLFGRDLLAAGLIDDTGLGDIRLWPSTDEGVDMLYVSLSSPDGEALLEFNRDAIKNFLAETYEICPVGSEVDDAGWDHALWQLLDES